MLVLSRRVGEEVTIGGGVRVTVVAIAGNRVRLGITAPASVRVDRTEVYNRLRALGVPDPGPSASPPFPAGDAPMQTAQPGDRVQVHYVKRFPDGSLASSRSRGHPPLEVTVGTDHPRLPGLGLGLVGLAPGSHVTLAVPAAPTPVLPAGRVRRLSRARFAEGQALPVGQSVRILDRRGRRRLVRILEVQERAVVVETGLSRAGQALEVDVELVAIHTLGRESPEV